METLAYLHLALADEAPLGTNELAIATLWKSPKLLTRFTSRAKAARKFRFNL